MQRGREQDGHHRQEEHAAQQRIDDGEHLRRGSYDRIDGSHAGQDHRCVESGVQPRKVLEDVVADGADGERGKDEATDDGGVSGQLEREGALPGAVG